METFLRKGAWLEKYRDLSFRRSFVLTVLFTFAIVVILSGISVWGCWKLRNDLLPDPEEGILTLELAGEGNAGTKAESRQMTLRVTFGEEASAIPYIREETEDGPREELFSLSDIQFSVVRLEKSLDLIGPRRKAAYQLCGVFMVLLPVLFSVTGILLCGFVFYRYKMERPLALLNQAMEKIGSEDLDFVLEYEGRDEMGRLCASFEKMRQTLRESYRTLWNMAQERRVLQASVAHDLRNPLAVLSGYIEYLQIQLTRETLSREGLAAIAGRLEEAAGRLEQYTESVRHLNRMQDMEVKRREINIREFARNMTEDFVILAAEGDVALEASSRLPDKRVALDRDMVYRVAENLMNNGVRFARKRVWISFALEKEESPAGDGSPSAGEGWFIIEIGDDGPGFSAEVLNAQHCRASFTTGTEGHLGLGLVIAKILCEKHGGRLELSNGRPQAAGRELSEGCRQAAGRELSEGCRQAAGRELSEGCCQAAGQELSEGCRQAAGQKPSEGCCQAAGREPSGERSRGSRQEGGCGAVAKAFIRL